MKNYFKILLSVFKKYDSQSLGNYQNKNLRFNVKDFFDGTIEGWGIFQDYRGKIIQKVKIVLMCNWQGEKGEIQENFFYLNGPVDNKIWIDARTWKIRLIDSDHFEGILDRIIGKIQGKICGDTLFMKYCLKFPIGRKNYKFNFEDDLFMISNEKVFNRIKMKKFGFTIGDMIVFFHKKNEFRNEDKIENQNLCYKNIYDFKDDIL